MDFTNGEVSEMLMSLTSKRSQFQEKRNYISLSGAMLPVDDILSRYKNGYTATIKDRLKCYKGYQMEADLLKRIMSILPEDVTGEYEISYAGGLIKGHPDFKYMNDPGDCKSVLKDDWLPDSRNKLPKRIYWQMQAYMLYGKMQYGGHDKALLIFESRESGLIRDYWIRSNKFIQEEIQDKFNEVLSLI